MSSSTVESRVINVVTKSLQPSDPKKVTRGARFVEDLAADSLDVVELLMAFEEEFKVEIGDADAQKIKTINDVIEYIEEQLKQQG